eukprot:scaffold230707_cov19-Prasinocladus_malaysianus.AAC.3
MPPFTVLALLHGPGYLKAISYILTLLSKSTVRNTSSSPAYKPSPTMPSPTISSNYRSASPIFNLALCDNGHPCKFINALSHSQASSRPSYRTAVIPTIQSTFCASFTKMMMWPNCAFCISHI